MVLLLGVPGGVWGAANIIPELAAELWDAVAVKGGFEAWVGGCGLRRGPVCKFLESHNYSAAVKTGVELIGQPTGGLRKPFCALGP